MDDYEEIRQLTYKYAYAVDCKQVGLHTGMWTDDAVLDYTALGLNRLTGFDQILRYFEYVTTALASSSHLTSNHIITISSADRASGTCYWRTEGRTASGERTSSSGCYHDQYARVDGSWRIAERVAVPLIPPDLKDLRPAPL
jgi:ketosteroid isomerase-like protein